MYNYFPLNFFPPEKKQICLFLVFFSVIQALKDSEFLTYVSDFLRGHKRQKLKHKRRGYEKLNKGIVNIHYSSQITHRWKLFQNGTGRYIKTNVEHSLHPNIVLFTNSYKRVVVCIRCLVLAVATLPSANQLFILANEYVHSGEIRELRTGRKEGKKKHFLHKARNLRCCRKYVPYISIQQFRVRTAFEVIY